MAADRERDGSESAPLKPSRTMLRQETEQAMSELRRSAGSLALSALTAGFGIGISLLLVAALRTNADGAISPAALGLLAANVYAIGFIIVILGRMDLFTEFTTIAVLPVLSGRATLRSLARFWAIIYMGNIIGVCMFALLVIAMGRELQLVHGDVVSDIALDLAERTWWVIVLSAILAGWLMGMLSWLIVGGRDTISQIFFIWIIAFTIGYAHLHHSVVGTGEVFAGLVIGEGIMAAHIVHFLLWTTIGNAIGGVVFAASIHFSIEGDGEWLG